MDATVRIRPSLTLSVTRDNVPTTDVTLNLDPASNPFDSEDLNIAVSTNNKTGYTLTMTTSDNGTNLVNVADSAKTIPTLSTSTTAAAFPANKWGYKKDSGNYQPFVTNTQILTNNTRTNEDTTTLSFAAKVDYTKESGLYKQDLVFAATPNMVTYYMQDLDPAVCSKDPIEAIDLRDNNTYYIAELDDGNCWMLQNLQLGNGLATTSGSMTLTPDDSNVSQDWTLTNKVPSPGGMPYVTIADDVTGSPDYVYDNNAFYCTPDSTNDYATCYYNWYTATAGKGTSNVTGKNTTGVDVNDSICPKGWVLPKGGADNSTNNFRLLANHYSSATDMLVDPPTSKNNADGIFKPGFLLTGLYISSGPNVTILGQHGLYWSRTAETSGYGYRLTITESEVTTNGSSHKYSGISVRCLRETRKIGDIENMQDISPAIVANTNEGSFKALKDTRDNQYYMVSKLKDGKIWMTQNLRLGTNSSSITLTPMDSNITASSWTLNGKVAAPGEFTTYTSCATGTCEDRYTSTTRYNNNNAYYCAPDSASSNNYVGCYYNWYSATASSGTSSITPVGTSIGYKDVGSSICPKGWYLPSGGGEPLSGSTSDRPDSDFNVLYNNYPSSDLMRNTGTCTTAGQAGCDNANGTNIPSFLLSGYYYSDGANYLGQSGYYWSRSAYSKGLAYALGLNSSAVYPQGYASKYHGFSVRCLAY